MFFCIYRLLEGREFVMNFVVFDFDIDIELIIIKGSLRGWSDVLVLKLEYLFCF